MADNMITPDFRAAYCGLFRASAPKDNPNGAKKYSVRALFPANTDLSALKQAAAQAASEKWGNNIPKALRSPFRTNGEIDNPIEGIPEDWIVMTFSANEDRRPGIVDANLQDIIDEKECYSGAWYRAQVRPYAYENAGNKGVSFGLQNIQKLRDDEPLGAGNRPANKVFTAVSGGDAPKNAGNLFD